MTLYLPIGLRRHTVWSYRLTKVCLILDIKSRICKDLRNVTALLKLNRTPRLKCLTPPLPLYTTSFLNAHLQHVLLTAHCGATMYLSDDIVNSICFVIVVVSVTVTLHIDYESASRALASV